MKASIRSIRRGTFAASGRGPGLRRHAGGRDAAEHPGSLVTFRSETTHEVTPVTHGVRYTFATWFR